MLSDTAGIAASSVPPLIAMQLLGVVIGTGIVLSTPTSASGPMTLSSPTPTPTGRP
jgi:hypothetical protein